mgnify:CR=1 FL=1
MPDKNRKPKTIPDSEISAKRKPKRKKYNNLERFWEYISYRRHRTKITNTGTILGLQICEDKETNAEDTQTKEAKVKPSNDPPNFLPNVYAKKIVKIPNKAITKVSNCGSPEVTT